MASPVVEFDAVGLSRGQRLLFDGLSFELKAGQTALIEGANISGKSSLLRALQRDPADCPTLSGGLRYRGRDVLNLRQRAYRSQVLCDWAFIPDCAASTLFPQERVRWQLASSGRSGDDSLAERLRAMGFADPERVLTLPAGQLSHGSKLAVAVLIQLLRHPSVLVLDDIVQDRDALGTDLWLAELKRRQRADKFCTIALCRSRGDYSALEPDVVVQLSGLRSLSSPSASNLVQLDTEQTVKKAGAGKPMLRVEHLSCIMSAGGDWLNASHDVLALREVTFDLMPGEWLAVVGASPSGKSTLALTLARLLEPTLGRVSLKASKEARHQRPGASRMLVCFEDAPSSIDLRQRVERILGEPLKTQAGEGSSQQVNQALRAVGLDRSISKRTALELSLGELQLLALARVLILDPAVLVLDNALSALSPPHAKALLSLLRGHRRERGLSTIVISHDIRTLAARADRVAVMYAGRIVELGTADEVRAGRHHPFTRVLLGSRPDGAQHLQLVIEGGVPEQSRLPSGCAFHPSCPRAEIGRCDTTDPELIPMAESGRHLVACWHPFV